MQLTRGCAFSKLHERMAFAIFRSPMIFFETTPTGRILNRFSRYVRHSLVAGRRLAPCFCNENVRRRWLMISTPGRAASGAGGSTIHMTAGPHLWRLDMQGRG